jgi:hypothetical protein
MTATKSNAWLGCLCRPQHPDDVGVAPQRPVQSTRSVDEAPSGKPPPIPIKASASSSSGSSRKSSNHQRVAFVPKHRSDQQIPMIPSPPSDDATPVMNNLRKRGGKKGSALSLLEKSPPESLLAPSLSLNGELKRADDDGMLFTNASSDSSYGIMKATTSEESNGSSSRKSRTSYYPNHVQDNIKAMRDYYEHAFTSPTSRPSMEDATETTEDEDITESTSAEELLRVDCHEDPFESAYVVWYQKGLLKWRPKSMPHRELDADKPSQFTFSGAQDDAAPTSNDTEAVEKVTAPSSKVVVSNSEKKGTIDEGNQEETKHSNGSNGASIVVFPPSTPTRIRIYQEEVSRSSSLQKTRQAPLVSVFGSPPQRRLASY